MTLFRRIVNGVAAAGAAVVLVTSGVPASAGTPAATTAAVLPTVDLRVPARVIYPARTTVTVVVTANGVPVPGATVTIYGKPAGTEYAPQYTGTTNTHGALAVALWIGSNTWYFASAVKTGLDRNTSGQRLVYLYPRIGIGTMPSTVRRGSTLVVTGALLPAGWHELPILQLQSSLRPYHWVATALSCDRFGHWVATWKVPANRQTGTFLIRAVLVGNQLHAQGTSSGRTLVVT